MMDQTLYTILSTDTTISSIVDGRITPLGDTTPGETEDRLIYRQVGGWRDYDCDGQGLAHGRFQVTAWSATHAGAATLGEAVRAVLSGYRDADDSGVQMILVENQGDIESLAPDETAQQYGKFIEIVMICKES